MKNLCFSLLFLCTLCNAQHTIKVLDSITAEPLTYVDIDLLNGFGIYTDANGNATIADNKVAKVEVSRYGYTTKMVTLPVADGIVLLNPEPILLDEVIVPARAVQAKIKTVKAKGHQNENRMAVSRVGLEYAVFVAGTDAETYLTALSVPLMEKDFVVSADYRATAFAEKGYKTVFKIEFLTNSDNKPGELIGNFEDVVVVDGAKSPKLYEHTISNEVLLPKEGLFVKFTVLGKADENGNLVNELPYTVSESNDGKRSYRFKQLQPNFPLDEVKKGQVPAYTHNAFLQDDHWKAIDKPLVFDPDKTYNGFTINIGYTVKTFK